MLIALEKGYAPNQSLLIIVYAYNFGSGCSAVWLARFVRDEEAGGSNPPTPTSYLTVGGLPTGRQGSQLTV